MIQTKQFTQHVVVATDGINHYGIVSWHGSLKDAKEAASNRNEQTVGGNFMGVTLTISVNVAG